MTVHIRKANLTDYYALVEVLWDCDRLHVEHLPELFQTPPGSRPETARTREYITGLMQDPSSSILLAEEAGGRGTANKIVGAIITGLRDTPPIPLLVPRRYATIDIIAVRPGWQGQGIGKALMQAAESWARSMGAREIELNVYQFNQNAIQFYESLGYSAISQRMIRKL